MSSALKLSPEGGNLVRNFIILAIIAIFITHIIMDPGAEAQPLVKFGVLFGLFGLAVLYLLFRLGKLNLKLEVALVSFILIMWVLIPISVSSGYAAVAQSGLVYLLVAFAYAAMVNFEKPVLPFSSENVPRDIIIGLLAVLIFIGVVMFFSFVGIIPASTQPLGTPFAVAPLGEDILAVFKTLSIGFLEQGFPIALLVGLVIFVVKYPKQDMMYLLMAAIASIGIAAFFVVTHTHLYQTQLAVQLFIGLFGWMTAFMAFMFRSIFIPTITHASFDSIQLLRMEGFSVELLTLIILVLVGIVMAFFWRPKFVKRVIK